MKKNLYIPISVIIISLTAIAGIFWYTLTITKLQKTNQQISNIQTPVGIEDNATQEQIHITSDIEEFSEEDLAEIDTSNWQTYRNEEYGFEFRYPERWVVEERSGIFYIFTNKYREGLPEGGGLIKIEINHVSLESFINDYNNSDMLPDGSRLSFVKSNRNVLFNDEIKATKITAQTAIGIDRNLLFFSQKSVNYYIYFHEFDLLHRAILSTFLLVNTK